jgi:membrane protein DedA with SNARE-associated domain/rhodanese-related sulfurtransferase
VTEPSGLMHGLAFLLERYGLLVIFLNVLLVEAGLPLPCYPVLIAAAALAGGHDALAEIVAIGCAGVLLADAGWFWTARRYGTRVLGIFCRISLSPDSCVRDTQAMLARVGPVSLTYSKFVPGLSNIAVAVAGATNVPVTTFAFFNLIGAIAFVSIPVLLGAVFRDAVDSLLAALAKFGLGGLLLLAAALGAYVLWKWWQRQRFIRQLRMDRITVDELRRLIDDGAQPVILDVRVHASRAKEGVIPGSIFANPSELDRIVGQYPPDAEVIVYCACPNEASAAVAAQHLKRAGFKKIRPLLGGIEAWERAGQPVHYIEIATAA